jgi:hypothetical protein
MRSRNIERRLAFEELESRDLLSTTPLFNGSQQDFLTAIIGSPPAEIGTPGTGYILGVSAKTLAKNDTALPGASFTSRPMGSSLQPIGSAASLSIEAGGGLARQLDAAFGAVESSGLLSATENANSAGGTPVGPHPSLPGAPPLNLGGPNATDAVGQMTISTGANTVGMNATPTSGYSGASGGTGGPSTNSQSKDPGDKRGSPRGDGLDGRTDSGVGDMRTSAGVNGGSNLLSQ